MDNDSWRIINYVSPSQCQIKRLLEHQKCLRQRELLSQQEAAVTNEKDNDGLSFLEPKTIQVGRDLKCKSHVRMMDGYDYWTYSLPASARNLNKNKEKVGYI